jgi:integrase
VYKFFGEKSTGLFFKGFKKTMLQNILPAWLKAAGITKHITFHVARHSVFSFQLKTSNLQEDFLDR